MELNKICYKGLMENELSLYVFIQVLMELNNICYRSINRIK